MNNKDQYDYDRDSDGVRKHKQEVSSFNMHDSELVFKALNLRKGDYFLDLGCGAGDYSVRAAKDVGELGMVYALDRWSEVTDKFTEKINAQGITNINVMACDILQSLPIKSDNIDVCLLATVLHIPNIARAAKELFAEISRVLKAGGRLVIIEIKKEEMSFGPPLNMRLSQEEVKDLIVPHGFEKDVVIDLGCNYMVQFCSGGAKWRK